MAKEFSNGAESKEPFYIDMFKHPSKRWKEWGAFFGTALLLTVL